MALVVINIDRDELPKHTDDQFEEWVRYEVGDRGGMSLDNPIDVDMNATVREI